MTSSATSATQMIMSNVQARRATIEDLQKLMPLWQQNGLPADDLAKRFQEFQVAEAEGGAIAGAIGLQIAAQDARLRDECFATPEDAEAVRAKLWERIQMISKNHGLVRIWTQLEPNFWQQNGFQAPSAELAAKLPSPFAGDAKPWLFLQLREDVATSPSIEKEFAMFKELQQEEREKAFRQARVMKVIALVAVAIVFALLIIWAVVWLKTPLRPGQTPIR